jgi:hypothetical protein
VKLYVVLGPRDADLPAVFADEQAAYEFGRRLAKSRCVSPDDYAEEVSVGSVVPTEQVAFVYSDGNRVRMWETQLGG